MVISETSDIKNSQNIILPYSMYGARGSNGVIIITTKRGAEGKVTINFDARVGINSRGVPAYSVINNPGVYYEMTWESFRNALYYTGALPDLAKAGKYASAKLLNRLGPYNIYKNVADDAIIDPATGKLSPSATTLKWKDNWNKDLFRNGLRHEYNLSVSGGSDKTREYMSVSYLKDDGYMVKSTDVLVCGGLRMHYSGSPAHHNYLKCA